VLLLNGGPLLPEYRAATKTFLWMPNWLRPLDSLGLWGKRRASVLGLINTLRLAPPLFRRRHTLIYANTIATCPALPWLSAMSRCPILCHVHEMAFIANQVCPEPIRTQGLKTVARFIAVSEPVELLLKNFGVDDARIAKIPEFFSISEATHKSSKDAVREQLGLPRGVFLVCGAGSMSWRKGTDYFLLVAMRVRSRMPDAKIHFVWLGDAESSLFKTQTEHDRNLLGLADTVSMPGSVTESHKYIAAADVFALTSREDPFPLVALEAGSLGLPVVCFEGRVGSTAFVDQQSGKVVPYADVEGFASALIEFYRDPERLQTASTTISTRAKAYDITVVAPQILLEIERVAGAVD
jgi:glycosyltransferase involved in cell wall biosynthesis